jgi:hypothetical protein
MFKLIVTYFFTISFAFSQKGNRSQLIIPPKQIVQIDYPLYRGFNVKIWNQSKFLVGISSRDKETDSVHKIFDLKNGNSILFEVNQGDYLQFENRFLASLKVAYNIQKGSFGKKKSIQPLTPQRAFYLVNNTAQTLPLHIPGIMNPKLNPYSRSGVDLPNGQKIYLDLKDNQILIFTVTDSIPNGARIDLANLIDKALNN